MPKLILNGKEYANNKPDGYPPLIYSDEEREVGVWRDGKPIYQKTIIGGSASGNTGIDLTLLNIDKFIGVDSSGTWAKRADNSVIVTLNFNAPNGATYGWTIEYNESSKYLWIGLNAFNLSEYCITLQYTKTTDTAGSGTWTTQGTPTVHYSTTEHIIGTWINNKPIYEITYEFTSDLSVIQDDWTDTPIQKGNIDKIISSEALHSSSTQWGCISARVTSSSNYVQLFNSRATSISVRYVTLQYTKTTD